MALTITESTLFPVRRDKQVASVGSTGSTLISGGAGGGVSDHNSLIGLQGGDSADFYHLDETQYNSMVTYSGTPVDNQVAVFSSANTIEGSTNLTFDGTKLNLTGNLNLATTGNYISWNNLTQYHCAKIEWDSNEDLIFANNTTNKSIKFITNYGGTATEYLYIGYGGVVASLLFIGSTSSGIYFTKDAAQAVIQGDHGVDLKSRNWGKISFGYYYDGYQFFNDAKTTAVCKIGKDGKLYTNHIGEFTASHGVRFDNKIGINSDSTDSMVRSLSTTSQVSAVFGEALVTADLGIGIGVDAESRGVNTGSNYGLYAGAANANYNYAIYIENNWPPAGANNYAIYSASDAKSFFAGNIIADADVQNPDFTSGFGGAKWQITEAGNAEFNNMRIRGGLQVYEMIINRLHYQNGNLSIGPGAGKVRSISSATQGSEQMYFETPEGQAMVPFSAGAIVMIHSVDIDRQTAVKSIVRQVSAVQEDGRVDMTTTAGWAIGNDVGVFEVGDEACTIGHTSDTDLQNSIYLSAIDSGNPFMRIYAGVSSYEKWNLTDKSTIKLQLGNLASLASYDILPASPGYGLYCDNVYLKGTIEASAGEIGGWIIDSDSIYVGTKYETGESPYTDNGLTINSDGTIRSENFAIDETGAVNIRTPQPHWMPKVASNNLRHSHDSEIAHDVTDYVQVKGIVFPNGLRGTIRVKYDGLTTEEETPFDDYCYAKICIDGVIQGSEDTIISSSYTTFTHDITCNLSPENELQLWIMSARENLYCYVRNFRVYYDDDTTNDVIAVASINSFPK